MSLAVAGRDTSSGRVFQKMEAAIGMSDGRLLSDGTAGRAAAARTTTAEGDDLAGINTTVLLSTSSMLPSPRSCSVRHTGTSMKVRAS